MESAYLKNSVGPVLAKAVAETVLAQPSNPQEYLALYLLHVLQEEERVAACAALQRKVEAQRQVWAAERAVRERRAADAIHRFFARYAARVRARRAAEAALLEQYEDAEADADALLEPDEEPDADADGGVAEARAEMREARADFLRAQSFMRFVRPSHLGALKMALLARREAVRAGQDRAAADAAATTRGTTATPTEGDEGAEGATGGALLVRAARPRHERVDRALLLYRVLRGWCYALLGAAPRATDTPAKVAALLKPSVWAERLRAFHPTAAYPFAGESQPPPRPRQVRRVARLLRVWLSDGARPAPTPPADDEDEESDDAPREEAAARAEALVARVEAAAKAEGVVLFALLRLLRAASAFRVARDAWLAALQQHGAELPPDEEPPEEEDADPNNEEALRDEEGEVDAAAVRRMEMVIGVDEDEALAKVWEELDEAEREKWRAIAAARKREESAQDEDEEEVEAEE